MWDGRAFLHRKNARFYPFSFRNQVSPFSILGRMFEAIIGVHVMRNGIIFVVVITFIEELFSSHSLNTVFHYIRNHEYEIKMPEDVSITHQEINYAGFKFKIPALCFGNTSE